jgi:translation initiation factor IF-1
MPEATDPMDSEGLPARVLEVLPSALFRVELLSQGRPRATVHVEAASGPLRVREGDEVLVRLSPQDPGRGRIVSLRR